jgi:hypothetical protein
VENLLVDGEATIEARSSDSRFGECLVGDQETERVADAVGRYGEVGCRQG